MDAALVPGTRPRVIIAFDLDGTLIDSAPDICAMASAILRARDLSALTLEETRQFIGQGSAVFVRRMMAARELGEDETLHGELHREFLSRYETAVEHTVPYPAVVETLTALREAGYPLGVCTNKPGEPARAVLAHLDLDHFFDAVIAGDMVQRRKPDPQMLLQVRDELGGGAIIYVGDSEIDAQTAERASVPFALYSGGYRKASVEELHHDWVFDDFEQLSDVVREAARN